MIVYMCFSKKKEPKIQENKPEIQENKKSNESHAISNNNIFSPKNFNGSQNYGFGNSISSIRSRVKGQSSIADLLNEFSVEEERVSKEKPLYIVIEGESENPRSSSNSTNIKKNSDSDKSARKLHKDRSERSVKATRLNINLNNAKKNVSVYNTPRSLVECDQTSMRSEDRRHCTGISQINEFSKAMSTYGRSSGNDGKNGFDFVNEHYDRLGSSCKTPLKKQEIEVSIKPFSHVGRMNSDESGVKEFIEFLETKPSKKYKESSSVVLNFASKLPINKINFDKSELLYRERSNDKNSSNDKLKIESTRSKICDKSKLYSEELKSSNRNVSGNKLKIESIRSKIEDTLIVELKDIEKNELNFVNEIVGNEFGVIIYDSINSNLMFQGDIKGYLESVESKVQFTAKKGYVPFVYLLILSKKSIDYIRLSLHKRNFLYVLNNIISNLQSTVLIVSHFIKLIKSLYLNDDLRKIYACVMNSCYNLKNSNYSIDSFKKYDNCLADMNIDDGFYVAIYNGEFIAFTTVLKDMINNYLFYQGLNSNISYFCEHIKTLLNKSYDLKFEYKFVKYMKDIQYKNAIFCIVFYTSLYCEQKPTCIMSEVISDNCIDSLVSLDKSKFVNHVIETDNDLFMHMTYDSNLKSYYDAHLIYNMVEKFSECKVQKVVGDIDYLITLKDGNIYYINLHDSKEQVLNQICKNTDNKYLRIIKDNYLKNNIVDTDVCDRIKKMYEIPLYNMCSVKLNGKSLNYVVFVIDSLKKSDYVNVIKTNKLVVNFEESRKMETVQLVVKEDLQKWIYNKILKIYSISGVVVNL